MPREETSPRLDRYRSLILGASARGFLGSFVHSFILLLIFRGNDGYSKRCVYIYIYTFTQYTREMYNIEIYSFLDTIVKIRLLVEITCTNKARVIKW